MNNVLYARLAGDATLQALVGTHIYPAFTFSNDVDVLPFLVFDSNAAPFSTLDGGDDSTEYQVTVTAAAAVLLEPVDPQRRIAVLRPGPVGRMQVGRRRGRDVPGPYAVRLLAGGKSVVVGGPEQRHGNVGVDRLDKRAVALDARKREIEPQLVPMTERARAIMEQLDAIRETITKADKLKVAQLLDSFVERVYPVFEVKTTKSKKKPRRTQIIGFRFVPKSTAKQVLAEEMKISSSRTGTGSSRRTARSRPGTWLSAPRD